MQNKIYISILFVVLNLSFCFCQENSKDRIALNKVVIEFEESIKLKDSSRFLKLFYDEEIPFTGIMAFDSEMSIKKEYPEFQGISVSDCKKFITDISKSDKDQSELFYNIDIETNGVIASISFDYSFHSDIKMIQWGNEKWNLVLIENQWLITDVIYSINFPDISPCPFAPN